MSKRLPSKAKIKNAEGGIAKIKSALVKLVRLLKGNRSKLLAVKSRLRTPAQKSRYAALAKVQLALEKSAKSQADKYKVLASTMGKFRSMAAAVAKGAKAAAGKVWETAKKSVSWLASKLKRKPKGIRGIGDIESLDDLGAAPLVIWGIVAATIAALSAAVGALLSKASKLEEQIDALNDEIGRYGESAQSEYDEEPAEEGYESEREPENKEDEYEEED